MPINIGTSSISKAYIGSSELSKIFLGATQLYPVASGPNTVAFETGDKVSDIDLTGFDNSGMTIELNGFSYDRTTDMMAISQSWNAWIRFRTNGILHMHLADDTSADIVRKNVPGVTMQANTVYDVKVVLTTTSYDILIDGVSKDSATFSAVNGVSIFDNINGVGDFSDSYSGDFNIQEIIVKDGLGAIVFQENGVASDWNTKLTSGSVTDV